MTALHQKELKDVAGTNEEKSATVNSYATLAATENLKQNCSEILKIREPSPLHVIFPHEDIKPNENGSLIYVLNDTVQDVLDIATNSLIWCGAYAKHLSLHS